MITYKGVKYPTRTIDGYTIATETLSIAIGDDYEYDEEAEDVDNSITYYATQEEFLLPESELKELLNDVLS